MTLTKEQLSDISLGFNWHPDMDFEQFAKLNRRINYSERFTIFTEIEQRYIEMKYENE